MLACSSFLADRDCFDILSHCNLSFKHADLKDVEAALLAAHPDDQQS
jgi:hypothetical protein